jgi:hypothetical protein
MKYRTRRLIRWCKRYSWKVKYENQRSSYMDLCSRYAQLDYDHEALLKICKANDFTGDRQCGGEWHGKLG